MSALPQSLSLAIDKLQQQPSVVAAKHSYEALSGRDQLIVRIVGLLLLVLLSVVLIINPLVYGQGDQQQQLDKSKATYELLASNAHRFSHHSQGAVSDEPILTLVTRLAKRHQINLKRFEPDGDGLRIWVEDAPFDRAIAWLEELNSQQGIQIKQINVDKSGQPGRVNLRASLLR